LSLRGGRWQKTGGKVHKEEPLDLYESPFCIPVIELGMARKGKMRDAHRVLVGKSEGE